MIADTATAKRWIRARAARFAKNNDGVTSIEFAIIALPFFSLIFGIMSMCLFFFVYTSVERGVWDASRDLRTGLLQNGGGAYNGLNESQLKQAFKDKVCSRMPTMIQFDCSSNMRVIVQSYGSNNAGISAPTCTATSGGTTTMITDANSSASYGDQNEVVMVTACYSWTYAKNLPIFSLPQTVSDGSYVMQASATFRNEPFR